MVSPWSGTGHWQEDASQCRLRHLHAEMAYFLEIKVLFKNSGNIFSGGCGAQFLNYQRSSMHHFAATSPSPTTTKKQKQKNPHNTDLRAISLLLANFFLSGSAAPRPKQAQLTSAKSLPLP